jgi:hypothetical protein
MAGMNKNNNLIRLMKIKMKMNLVKKIMKIKRQKKMKRMKIKKST